jgi:hypothetical protein
MVGRVGFFSQIVRDARPRAAPSLYAAPAAGPSDTLTYARLMPNTAGAAVPDAVTTITTAHSTPDVAVEGPVTTRLDDAQDDDQSLTTRRFNPHAPQFGQRPVDQVATQSFATTPVTGSVPSPEFVTTDTPSVMQDSPIARVVPDDDIPTPAASDIVTRPATFDVVRERQGHSDPTANMSKRTPETEPNTNPARSASQSTLRNDVGRAPRHASDTETVGDDPAIPSAVETTPVRSPQVTSRMSADQRTSVQNATRNGPSEVRIGQVEIVVQDPPPARRPKAPRLAAAAPSPSRYYVRRL